jgi:hypothetical protein
MWQAVCQILFEELKCLKKYPNLIPDPSTSIKVDKVLDRNAKLGERYQRIFYRWNVPDRMQKRQCIALNQSGEALWNLNRIKS